MAQQPSDQAGHPQRRERQTHPPWLKDMPKVGREAQRLACRHDAAEGRKPLLWVLMAIQGAVLLGIRRTPRPYFRFVHEPAGLAVIRFRTGLRRGSRAAFTAGRRCAAPGREQFRCGTAGAWRCSGCRIACPIALLAVYVLSDHGQPCIRTKLAGRFLWWG